MTSPSSTSLSPIDRMNAYKGAPTPDIIVPLSGLTFGMMCPYAIFSLTPAVWASFDPTQGILLLLQAFSLQSLLFLTEFGCGLAARGTSPKASFSPAAAQATGISPFAVVQSNRIHQNHIESACIYIPAALAAVAAGADVRKVVATSVSWVLSRAVYRLGYCQKNPLWRISGTAASLTQSCLCLGLFVFAKIQ